jgi:hypothetical protein
LIYQDLEAALQGPQRAHNVRLDAASTAAEGYVAAPPATAQRALGSQTVVRCHGESGAKVREGGGITMVKAGHVFNTAARRPVREAETRVLDFLTTTDGNVDQHWFVLVELFL